MIDQQIIEKLGGVKAISKALGYKYTTVHNWTNRGISKDAKVAHPEIFMVNNLDDVKHIDNYLPKIINSSVVKTTTNQ